MSLQILLSLIVMKHENIYPKIYYDGCFFSPQSKKFIPSCFYCQNFKIREVNSVLKY